MRFNPIPGLSLCLFFLLVAWNVHAQKATMSFVNTSHHFGSIREEAGIAEHKFLFINHGDIPLKIKEVKASCGCTTPAWSADEILPADTGHVTVQYDPRNRPGPFSKTITVTSNGTPNVSVLTIEGNVLPVPESMAKRYPYKSGDLRFRHRILNIGNITTKGPVSRRFPVYNEGQDSIVFSDTIIGPPHILAAFEPQILPPGETGELLLTYNPAISNELGFYSHNIVLFTSEKEQPAKQFSVYATIEEYFPPLREDELSAAPQISFDKITHDFGEIEQGDTVETEFVYTNEGQEDLNLRKVKAICNCISVEVEKETLKHGEQATLKVIFDSSNMWGTQQKTIVLFTNDPKDPTRVLTLKGRVED